MNNLKEINKDFYTYIVSNSSSSYNFKTSELFASKKQVLNYISNDDSLNETQKHLYSRGEVKRKNNIKDIVLDYILQILKTHGLNLEYDYNTTNLILHERTYKTKCDSMPDMNKIQSTLLRHDFFCRFQSMKVLEIYFMNEACQKYYLQYVYSTKNIILYDQNQKEDTYEILK